MSASDWAAWVGAVTGVVALVREVMRSLRDGPRLLVRAQPNMSAHPDSDPKRTPILMVYATNVGNAATTLTTWVLWTFPSRMSRWRVRPERAWVVVGTEFGPALPQELQPGQQWMGGLRQDEEIEAAIDAGHLHIAVHTATQPNNPAIVRVRRKATAAVATATSSLSR